MCARVHVCTCVCVYVRMCGDGVGRQTEIEARRGIDKERVGVEDGGRYFIDWERGKAGTKTTL